MFSSGNANMDTNTNPCYCIASDSDMTLSGLGLGPYLPWPQVVGLAPHSRLLLSPSSFFSAQAAPLLFLSHLTTTDSNIVVAPLQAGHG